MHRVAAGEAVRVMTGARLPAACDCVIRQEDVKLRDAQGCLVDGLPPEKVLQRRDAFSAEIPYALRHHQNYCFAGEDIQQGACLIREGTVLKAAQLGVLASMGIARVRVWRRPRIVLHPPHLHALEALATHAPCAAIPLAAPCQT